MTPADQPQSDLRFKSDSGPHFKVTFESLWGGTLEVTFEPLLGHFNSFCVSVDLGARPLQIASLFQGLIFYRACSDILSADDSAISLESRNRKRCRQTGSQQSTPLSTIRTRYGNSVSTPDGKPHGLTKRSTILSKREADMEFQYRPHIVDTDTDCGRHFCGRHFRDSFGIVWVTCCFPHLQKEGSVRTSPEQASCQGSVNGGFQTVVRVWSGEQIPAPHFTLDLTSVLPLFNLFLTSF